jgi:hypothetical protein
VKTMSGDSLKTTVLAGGIAGGTEVLIMYPLDTLKTRAQQNVGTSHNYLRTVTGERQRAQPTGW